MVKKNKISLNNKDSIRALTLFREIKEKQDNYDECIKILSKQIKKISREFDNEMTPLWRELETLAKNKLPEDYSSKKYALGFDFSNKEIFYELKEERNESLLESLKNILI